MPIIRRIELKHGIFPFAVFWRIFAYDEDTEEIIIPVNHPLMFLFKKKLNLWVAHELAHYLYESIKPLPKNRLHGWFIENVLHEWYALKNQKRLSKYRVMCA